jgi:hypothetical protein
MVEAISMKVVMRHMHLVGTNIQPWVFKGNIPCSICMYLFMKVDV